MASFDALVMGFGALNGERWWFLGELWCFSGRSLVVSFGALVAGFNVVGVKTILSSASAKISSKLCI